jgi:uncharacterized membrane protein YkoI
MDIVSALSANLVHRGDMTRNRNNGIAAILAAHLILPFSAPALADDDARDQALARQALEEGRIRSLSEITEIVKPTLPGTILAVELEIEDDGSMVYEFDVLDPDGKLKEVDVDAATGEILSIEDDD